MKTDFIGFKNRVCLDVQLTRDRDIAFNRYSTFSSLLSGRSYKEGSVARRIQLLFHATSICYLARYCELERAYLTEKGIL